MKRIDANVILRYLLDDHEELSPKSAAIIDRELVYASVEVICEVVYVLGGVYKVNREPLSTLLLSFIDLRNISVDDLDLGLLGTRQTGYTILLFLREQETNHDHGRNGKCAEYAA